MIIPQKFTARLADRVSLNDRFAQFRFELERPAKIVNEAGQYIMIEVADKTKRAYSMCDRPDVDSSFEIILDYLPNGVGVNFLKNLDFGACVNVFGPLGQLTMVDDDAEDIYLLATGSGIAPFKAILTDQLQIKKSQRRFTLIWSMATDTEFFWLEDWLNFQQLFPNFTFIPLVDKPSPAWSLATGFIQDALANLDLKEKSHFYLCGNPLMIKSVGQFLAERNFHADQITTEQFFADRSNQKAD